MDQMCNKAKIGHCCPLSFCSTGNEKEAAMRKKQRQVEENEETETRWRQRFQPTKAEREAVTRGGDFGFELKKSFYGGSKSFCLFSVLIFRFVDLQKKK